MKFHADASYVINGVRAATRHYLQGKNGDLWTQMHQELLKYEGRFTFHKVKSHVKDKEEWTQHGMMPEGCFYNEAADNVAGEVADLFGRCGSDVLSDEKQLQVAYAVARRFAIIEASICREFGQVEHNMHTFF